MREPDGETTRPRSIMGVEMSHAEVAARTRELADEVSARRLPAGVLGQIEAFEAAEVLASEKATTWLGLLFGGVRTRFHLVSLKRAVRLALPDRRLAREAVALTRERVILLRRVAYLKKTKRLFDLWRVYHKPLATVMALIVTLHVAIVWYFGYGFWGR